MSEENLEIYRRTLDAFNRRDKDAWLAACDPELENIPPRDWPESREVRGSEAVWDFLVEGNEPWEENRIEIFELLDAGDDKIVAEIRSEVRGKSSGAAVPWSFWHVITLRNGLALRFEYFADRAEALKAAGVSE